MIRLVQRLFRFGSKYGVSRGIAMYVQDSDIRGRPEMLMPERLHAWMRDRGRDLTYSSEGLEAIDLAVDELSRDPTTRTMLDLEVGKFLGVVLVSRVDGARWHAWPNGHPVVRLADDRDIDVLAIATKRISTGSPRLTEVLFSAM
ncbi:DUF6278 family protein [Rhodococcus gannanensis]|uniref:DUF6278 family protein n=1 Tax=Rhodococcus gannanensis TaxID=1960308 RepID=A0ABW4P8Z2_9NOCA